jgi:predicted nucleic acid-binding Zn ribbon protein
VEKRDPIEKLGEVLEKSLKRLDPSGRLGEYGVWPIWNEAVGDMVARNAQPEKIRQGTLFVKVSSPVWMQQLQYLKETIVEKINRELGKEVVKNIFFVIGKVEAKASGEANEKPEPPVSSAAPSRLDEETLGAIKDPEIRRALKRLFSASSRNRKD